MKTLPLLAQSFDTSVTRTGSWPVFFPSPWNGTEAHSTQPSFSSRKFSDAADNCEHWVLT